MRGFSLSLLEQMQKCMRSLRKTFHSWQNQERLAEKLSVLSIQGRLDEAVQILHHSSDHFHASNEIFLKLIRSCIKHKSFEHGKEIHRLMIGSGVKTDVVLLNNLMMMYSKCGNIELTRQLFDEMSNKNLFSWTAMIGAYANCGDAVQAFEFYKRMILAGIQADNFLYPLVLKSCAGMNSLRDGRRVHADIISSGFHWDLVVLNSIIDMYRKCNSLADAEKAFDEIVLRDIFTWTTMLIGYVQLGKGLDALKFFKEFMHSGVKPSSTTFVGIIPVFSNLGCLKLAKQIHGLAVITGFDCDKILGTSLVDMYANCGSLGYSRLIFNGLNGRDIVCWNTMIKGYSEMEFFGEAIQLFKQMTHIDGVIPDKSTWDCIVLPYLQKGLSVHSVFDMIDHLEQVGVNQSLVSATLLDQICDHVTDVQQVKELCCYLNKRGHTIHSVATSKLIQICSKFADSKAAQEIFYSVNLNLDCWNFMIACYACNGYATMAKELFDLLQRSGMEPNLLSWNTLISVFVDAGDSEAALHMLSKMKWALQSPDATTFDVIVPVIGSISCPMTGKELHGMLLRNGCAMNKYVCTALINMYGNYGSVAYAVKLFKSIESKHLVSWNAIISSLAKNGFMDEAAKIFHEMKMTGAGRNIITWTTLVSGYARHGQANESLNHFRELQLEGLRPNSITIASVLPACGQSAMLFIGKSVHGYVIRSGFDDEDLVVSNALMYMYIKCGHLEYAERVFRKLPRNDLVSWNTMIHGFAINGKAIDALSLFNEMLSEGAQPNNITFIGVLNACSHAGLIDEGWRYFNNMESKYGIRPSGKHYACMVDILGRGGHFEVVKDFIVQMPVQPTASLWGALLSACKTHGNVEMAEYAASKLIELQPENPGNYVLLSNIYALAGRWNDVDQLRKMMVERGVKKFPGGSWIETGNSHAFEVDSVANLEMEDMHKQDLTTVMFEEGCT